ncbi:MAG: NifU family protein [Anaerolineae bacterium]|nr:NifU family protein [Anaerolineae bacterium]
MNDIGLEFSTEERLRALIDTLDAYINHYHGGNVELVGFDGKTVTVRLGGACNGCPLTSTTLNGWVAGTLRQFFPEIEHVVDVSDQ